MQEDIARYVQRICKMKKNINAWSSVLIFQRHKKTHSNADFFRNLFLCTFGFFTVFLEDRPHVRNIQLLRFIYVIHCWFTSNTIL